MKHIQDYCADNTSESLKTFFGLGPQYDPYNSKHRQLYKSFISWFDDAEKHFDRDIIMSMLRSAEEDIELGQV